MSYKNLIKHTEIMLSIIITLSQKINNIIFLICKYFGDQIKKFIGGGIGFQPNNSYELINFDKKLPDIDVKKSLDKSRLFT